MFEVRWTRTTVGGPNDLGGSVTTFKQFLGLVYVFGHLVTRRKNLANQIHKLLVTIN
jgi:hypothetical protein